MLIIKSLLLSSLLCFAGVLPTDLGARSFEIGSGASKGVVNLAGQGLRVKKIAFVKVKVYDAFLYVTDATAVKREKGAALDSIASQSRWMVGLKFRRDVDGDRIMKSFGESLAANHLDAKAEGLKEFLAAVQSGGEVKEGQTLLIAGLHGVTGDLLTFQNAKGELSEFKATPVLLRNVLSIWFGAHDESALDDLEMELLKAP